MPWPQIDAGEWRRFSFIASIREAGRAHDIEETLWARPPFGALHEGNPNAPVFSMRSSGEAKVEFDHVRRQCLVRLGEPPDSNFRALLSHLAGPAAPVLQTARDSDWTTVQTDGGTRWRPPGRTDVLTYVVVDERGFPVRAVSPSTRVSWRLLDERLDMPPDVADVSDWALEVHEATEVNAFPAELASLPQVAAFAFRSSRMSETLQFATWEKDDSRIDVVVGDAPEIGSREETSMPHVAAISVAGIPGMILTTDDQLTRWAVESLEGFWGRDAQRVASIGQVHEESTASWTSRIVTTVVMMSDTEFTR